MSKERIRFDEFELDPENFQLRDSGGAVKLERIPLELLILLAGKAGRLLTREEILKSIWGEGTFLDTDNAINTAIRKIRRALHDGADRSRYIETVAGKGYRFIAVPQVEGVPKDDAEIPGAGRIMLAVLPLENLNQDPEQEYFSEGLTEDIITQLGGLSPHRLGVIARTSVMKYQHTRESIREIGSRLRVGYVLEGTVRRFADRVRVTAQLIRVSDETHLWAESYERQLSDILQLQAELAREVASQIRVRLVPRGNAPKAEMRPVNPEAYEAYLKGRHFWNRKTEKGLLRSLGFFSQCIELEPEYAIAHAGMADAYILLGIHGFRPASEVYPRAESLAKRALELDESLAEAHTALADVRKGYHCDFPAAEAGYKRAIDLNHSYAVAYQWYSDLLFKMGRHAEAIQAIERAREIDPLSLAINAFVAFTYYRARRPEEAVREGIQAVDLDPNLPLGHWFLGLAYEGAGLLETAVLEMQKAVDLSGRSPLYVAALGHACGLAGDRLRAQSMLDELMRSSLRRYVSSLDVAIVYAGMGENDSAFVWLEKACQERVMRVQELPQPTFDGLRSDPRFGHLMRRVGLRLP
jgi:TolB-like protein/Tfp pilus assembly protein PilF